MSVRSREIVVSGTRRISVLALAACAALAFGLALPAGSTAASVQLTATSISAGLEHSCAIRPSGQAVCWGSNGYGRLGDGTTLDRRNPTPVKGLTDAIAISAGLMHSCAIRSSGQAVCWGSNGAGSLGNGSENLSLVPVPVSGLNDAVAISAGAGYSCAVRSSGQALCWGSGNNSQLGDGTFSGSPRHTPNPVSGLNDAVTISAGWGTSCAVRSNGQAVCWGSNMSGQIGDGTNNNSAVPVPVFGQGDTASISAGQSHTCLVTNSGQAFCWGANWSGQLGDGSNSTGSPFPVSVQGLADSGPVTAGGNHACAVRASGQSVCWGLNYFGQIGDGTSGPGNDRNVPTAAQADAETVAAGAQHTCAIRRISGRVLCWGYNYAGQLGDGTLSNSAVPVAVLASESDLTVSRTGTGEGSVTGSPVGIDCGFACSASYDDSTEVTLTAAPDPGSMFAGWSGDCSGSGLICTVTVDQARAVTATFEPTAPPVCSPGQVGAPPDCVTPLPPVGGPTNETGTYDPATGRLVFRMLCPARFRPKCRGYGEPVTRKGKAGKVMGKRVRNALKAGKRKTVTLTIRPAHRTRVALMTASNKRSLVFRQVLKSSQVGKRTVYTLYKVRLKS